MVKICEDHPDIRTALKLRSNPGRPRIELEQPLLLKKMIEIAMYGSAAHEKRQSDIYRSVKTLDELTAELKKRWLRNKQEWSLPTTSPKKKQ